MALVRAIRWYFLTDGRDVTFELTCIFFSAAPSEVTFLTGTQTQFLDYVSCGVLAVAVTGVFCAAALEDGSVNVYSQTGRRYVADKTVDVPSH